MLYALSVDAMHNASFLLRAKQALGRYFSVMPATVAPDVARLQEVTQDNLRASEANVEAGLKLMEELNTLAAMMREDRKR